MHECMHACVYANDGEVYGLGPQPRPGAMCCMPQPRAAAALQHAQGRARMPLSSRSEAAALQGRTEAGRRARHSGVVHSQGGVWAGLSASQPRGASKPGQTPERQSGLSNGCATLRRLCCPSSCLRPLHRLGLHHFGLHHSGLHHSGLHCPGPPGPPPPSTALISARTHTHTYTQGCRALTHLGR